ncbi:MAG: serine/threonine protein kinase, partial [Planctomycetaceae bacterium]
MTSGSGQSTDNNYPDGRIAALLERHGNAIRNQQPLRIEDLLLEVQPEYRSEFLIELLMQELELRQPPPARDQVRREFRDRFPEYLNAVSAALRQWRPEISVPEADPVAIGEYLGKYQIRRRLGAGKFGTVYLAHDPGLNRDVALKVPLTRPPEHDLDPDFDAAAREQEAKRYERELEVFRKKMDQYRQEARLLAAMDHPELVRIYDVFDNEHEVPILVQEFVEGKDLRQYLKQEYRDPGRHVPILEAIRLVRAICEGLTVAHQKEIYHRDLKPANILLDGLGRPKIADFGLALHASQLHSRVNLVEGTLAYMAPEQIDGQTPRIDGRSDLWAVGVMLYEMVAGQHPFRWEYSSSREILRGRIRQSILESDPTPLHQLRDDVPEELDRICRRCLQPKKDERFDSIRRLSEDLAELAAQLSSDNSNRGRPQLSTAPPSAAAPLDSPSGSTGPGSSTAAELPQSRLPLKVSPRGLLAFTGAEQAEFLQLLPGVPDRHGLPPAVAFWKHRIEAGSLVRPFAVGLLYGPSGCGKTSLMRAGILPRLAPNVRAHYVEATAADTEVRILKDLRATWKDLPQVDLPEMLWRIREQGQWLPLGHRLLVVVDQFEQWLHANHSFPQQQLTNALAQCDGARVQVILMIREEFIPLAEQFFSQLSIPLDANHNRFRLDLFDQSHARKVLTLFGVAQGQLPESVSAHTRAQNQFLKEAVKQLSSERGEVISVHLALFVEMFGNREWTPERLREVGGVERLGVRFLEDSFRREENRRYSMVAQRVLRTLLPQEGSSDTDETPRIKGAMRSRNQLQQAAEMEHQGDEFDRLMDKLEKTLRLITPTTPDGITATPPAAQADRCYQLTHDYLVPAVTDWIKQKQRETRSGQAELKLGERTVAWQRKKERRQLPSLMEWAQIRWHVPRGRWTEMQGRMMQAAAWLHLVRGGIALLLLFTVFLGTAWLQRQATRERAEALAGSFAQQKTSDLAASLVPLQLLRDYALPTLQKL